MRFLRGIVCLTNFLMYTLGFCLLLASFLMGEPEIRILGIIPLMSAFGLSLIESRFYPKGKRARCAAFFSVNGALIFLNMTLVFIPVARMISTMLDNQRGDFYDWKYGLIWDQSEERLSKKKPVPMVWQESEENGSNGFDFGSAPDDTPEFLRSPDSGDSYRVTTGVWGNDTKYVIDENGNHKPVHKTSYGTYIDNDGNEYLN